MLHRKSPEFCNPNVAGNTGNGSFVVSDKSNMIPNHDIVYFVSGVSAIWNYNADNDGWMQLPNSGVTGTFGAGSCGEFRTLSAPGGVFTQIASAGSTTTINTTLTITRDLAGCEIRVIDGAGAGYVGNIKYNTLGTNAIITVETASGSAFNNTTKYQIFAGSLWFFNAGTTAVGFSVYDRATNAWTARSVTGLPIAWGTDAQLVSTGGRMCNGGTGFVNGTADSATTTTITLDASKVFLLNQWNNNQIRIISGTGQGQIRSISSNTAGASPVVTVSTAWTVVPDSSSVYRIEGNDDYFYLLGNNAVTMYRFVISTNTWSTLAPTAARAGAHAAGGTVDWIDNVKSAEWNDGLYTDHYNTTIKHQNGRYLYCFRGGATSTLDVYDIAANTWISGVVYGQQMETFTTGSCSVDLDGFVFIQKEATGRILRFDIAKNILEPFTLNPIPQGTAVTGDKMFLTTFTEGGTVNFLYTLGNTRSELTRWVII
jgi:hypothetical protein